MGIRAPSAGEQQGTIEVSGETLLGPRLWSGKGGGGQNHTPLFGIHHIRTRCKIQLGFLVSQML